MKKILISGYYGFDNFGDDIILYVLVSALKKHLDNPKITVLSNNPAKTKKLYDVDSIYRFNTKEIMAKMENCHVFISGGGSLIQNVTSFKSLLYYLGLIFLSKFIFHKKAIIFAQGIGPINGIFAKILSGFVLKKADLISVRDRESYNLLKNMGIESVLATDTAWCLDVMSDQNRLDVEKINIGIQLRRWKDLKDSTIDIIANAICEKFNDEKVCISLISLQDDYDLAIAQKLKTILLNKNLKAETRIFSNLSIEQSISLLGNIDFLIGMRYHACLISTRFDVPTLALSYDPKVKNLALESKIPYININSITKDVLNSKINELITKKDEIRSNLKEFADKKVHICNENIILLINSIILD